jgi:hypothetical protein
MYLRVLANALLPSRTPLPNAPRRAAIEFDADFQRLIAKSTSATGEERYLQERTTLRLRLECFFMMAYALAAALRAPGFEIATEGQLNKTPEMVTAAFERWRGSLPFAQLLVPWRSIACCTSRFSS